PVSGFSRRRCTARDPATASAAGPSARLGVQPRSQTARPAAKPRPTTTATNVPVRLPGLAMASLSVAASSRDSEATALVGVTALGNDAAGAAVGGTAVGAGIVLAGASAAVGAGDPAAGSGRTDGASAIIVPPRGGSAGRAVAGFTPGGGVSGGAAGVRIGDGAPNTVQPRVSDSLVPALGPAPGAGPGPAFGVETSGWLAQ